MELELKLESRLSAYVALTVVIISVFMAFCKLKDENLVDGMTHNDVKAVDAWNEYHSERIKLQVDENGIESLKALLGISGAAAGGTTTEIARLIQNIAITQKQMIGLQDEARGYEATYAGMESRHIQFDMTDALCSLALALAAVAALASYLPLLFAAWASSGFGMLIGICAIEDWNFHPEFLVRILS